MGWLNLIDGILIILLVATIFCAVSLSRRLSSLRSDKKNLEKLMGEFHHISEKADKSLTFAKASKPFKSNLGLPGSAYPSFCALVKTFLNDS